MIFKELYVHEKQERKKKKNAPGEQKDPFLNEDKV